MSEKIKSIHRLAGRIVLESGLHIGAGNDTIEIGGLDNPVVKDVSGKPYIPGSSIKGKLRSIMEWCEGKVKDNNEPCSCGDASCAVCRIFGAHKAVKMRMGPPRLIVRDAVMCKRPEALSYTEAKYENTIQRIDGTATNPRQLERVHPGTEFAFEILYRNYMADEKVAEEDREKIVNGLKLVEHDYLGGCGSRGSGKVRFEHDGWQQVFPK